MAEKKEEGSKEIVNLVNYGGCDRALLLNNLSAIDSNLVNRLENVMGAGGEFLDLQTIVEHCLDLKKLGLGSVCKELGLGKFDEHCACADAKVTFQIFEEIKKRKDIEDDEVINIFETEHEKKKCREIVKLITKELLSETLKLASSGWIENAIENVINQTLKLENDTFLSNTFHKELIRVHKQAQIASLGYSPNEVDYIMKDTLEALAKLKVNLKLSSETIKKNTIKVKVREVCSEKKKN